MNLSKKLWQSVIVGLVVTLGLSIYADFEAVIRSFRSFDWWLFPLVLGLTLGNQFLRFLKWEYLLRRVDVDLPLSTSFHVFGSGLIMIMTPGKLGEVWKSWLVRDVEGTPISTTIPVIAVERITDLLGVVCISLLGVLAFDYSPLVPLLLVVAVVGGIVLVQYESACYWLLDSAERVPILSQRTDELRELYENSCELLRLRPLTVTTALSVFSWGLECIGLWVVLFGFGADVSLLVAAFVFAISSIFGAVSLLPGGLGVTEGTMTGLLLVFGVERAAAASATLVIRAATLWFVTALALAVYVSFRGRESVDITEFEEENEM